MTASHRHADHEEPGSVAVFAAVVSASRSTTGPVSDPEVLLLEESLREALAGAAGGARAR